MIRMWAILGIGFIFVMTSLGAAVVMFTRKSLEGKMTKILLSFAGGVMFAASVFSLIIPALNYNDNQKSLVLPIVLGIIFGGLFILLFDIFLNKISQNKNENISAKKLFFAMTIHNIPEGLSVGLSFGMAFASSNSCAFVAPLLLALGIGIQNFPEGAAASMPMLSITKSKKKSFLLGVLSGSVEPIAAIIGLLLANKLSVFMPFILSFGAGAMLYVVIDELIITKGGYKNKLITNIFFLFGFLIMMILDVILS